MNTVYFTSDDGVLNGTTNVADTALAYGIPVTFFFVGLHVMEMDGHRQVYEQMRKTPGFEVCNHSYTHAQGMKYTEFYADVQYSTADILKNSEIMKFNNRIVRLPGRNTWRTSTVTATAKDSGKTADAVRKAGFDITGWDLELGNTAQPDPFPAAESFIGDMKKKLAPGSDIKTPGHLVILTHDIYFSAPHRLAVLKQLFTYFKTSGEYQMRHISQYPGITPGLYNPDIA